MFLMHSNNLYYNPYQTSEQVISFMVLPSLSMPERPRWEYILYFPWSRLSYWLCVLTNAGNITLVFCPVLHPGTCGHRRRQKIWNHRTAQTSRRAMKNPISLHVKSGKRPGSFVALARAIRLLWLRCLYAAPLCATALPFMCKLALWLFALNKDGSAQFISIR